MRHESGAFTRYLEAVSGVMVPSRIVRSRLDHLGEAQVDVVDGIL